jgi:hypothetical protein
MRIGALFTAFLLSMGPKTFNLAFFGPQYGVLAVMGVTRYKSNALL